MNEEEWIYMFRELTQREDRQSMYGAMVGQFDVPNAPERPYGSWTPKLLFIFLKETRREIYDWLLVQNRICPFLPTELIHCICFWIATSNRPHHCS